MSQSTSEVTAPVLALTQGDPAGVGPEIVLRAALRSARGADWLPLIVAERSALEAVRPLLETRGGDWTRLLFLEAPPTRAELDRLPQGRVPVLDPIGERRALTLGESGPADAAGAVAALDLGADLARRRVVDALITAPLSKHSVATHLDPSFRGHTDYLAAQCALERYGRDYLMAFLSLDLRVALLSTHLPLVEAIARVDQQAVGEALDCLARHVEGRIAVAGLNPHAGEHGLMGREDDAILRPAVAAARARGVDAYGPESADSLFARARRGEFDWVLALYHDQGLIAVKTAAFGTATNWTLGLPYLRTSVDHGTAFELAGTGLVRAAPMREVIARTLELIATRRPPPR